MLAEVWSCLTIRRRRQFWLISILMVTTSLLEIISIGSLLPFLSVLIDPDIVYQHPMAQSAIQLLSLNNSSQIILPITLAFISAIIISSVARLILLYAITRFTYSVGADISIEVFRRTLYQNYSVHLGRNSSEIINGITAKTNNVIHGVLAPTLILISSSVMLLGIALLLFYIDIKTSLIMTISLLIFYFGIILVTRKKLNKNSIIIAQQSTMIIKLIQEGLGGIRDIIVDKNQEHYCILYRKTDRPFRIASSINQFISGSPRYVVEAFGMVLIVTIAYSFVNSGYNVAIIFPLLGTLALGAQKALPALQKLYGAYSDIKGSMQSLKDVTKLLKQPISLFLNKDIVEPMPFKKTIYLKNVYYSYKGDDSWVLKNIDLKIFKGDKVGIIGETGTGKSTLTDIIMGLLSPTNGAIIVDGEKVNSKNIANWQAHIAHVPQNIYLSDGTIEDNIAFGIPRKDINFNLVRESAKRAKILKFIEKTPNKYQTMVGECGVQLSGGQRQRIGIARALYKKADILFLDEATSALDNETERMVMEEIGQLNKEITIFIVAHRLSTLDNCNKIIKIDKNHMVSIKKYNEK